MADSVPPFEARLDAALAMNGIDNAAFAAHFGPNGQQIVSGWRKRGRIGTPSVPKARAALPKTNMDWLQEGHGDPERLSVGGAVSRSFHTEQSRVARLDLAILASAVKVISIDENVRGRMTPLQFATRLMDLYDSLVGGASQADLIARLFDDQGEASDAAQDTSPRRSE